jgi:DNA-binding PadR family transcriptional regulator
MCDMNSNLLRGSLDTIVIKLLQEHGEMYGYQMTQMVKEMTKDGIQLTEGALYPTLHKLEAKEILTVETRQIGNRMRKYYRLTPEGTKHAVSLLQQMTDFLRQMDALFQPIQPAKY